MSNDFFAPPPFKPAEALIGLRRQLRDLKLTERAGADPVRFELAGSTVLELQAQADEAGEHLVARLTRRPARTPEWETRSLRSGADVRSLLDEIRRRLARWDDERD
ncbi:MAG: hypothetical protein HZB72_05490 [Burkholderiales bacterium]|nr:hypothetical protein [Burkholderiales bacterium]